MMPYIEGTPAPRWEVLKLLPIDGKEFHTGEGSLLHTWQLGLWLGDVSVGN